jgi:hypothetical protein
MPLRSPTLEGFRTVLRQPSFGIAEMSWRWSFGAASALLISFAFFAYLDTLPVSSLDLLLLKTRQPTLVAQAFAHIFEGSALRFVKAGIVLGLALAIGWIIVAAHARAATIRSLVQFFREISKSDLPVANWSVRPLIGLNFFRVAATLAALVGSLAAMRLLGVAGESAPGVGFFLAMSVLLLVWLAWGMVNWVLSLSAVFAVVKARDTFDSIVGAVDLCRERTGSVLAAGASFGVIHLAALLVASSAMAFPLSFAGILPPAVLLGGVAAVALIYFAAADFLYMGRLAAYVAMVEFPRLSTPLPAFVYPESLAGGAAAQTTSSVDQDEVILSDIPLQE